MELRQLALFVMACQHIRHIDAAAAAGLSPSSLSEQLGRLEAALGQRLFARGPLGQVPTEAARVLFPQVVALLHEVEAASCSGPLEVRVPLRVESFLAFMFGPLSRAMAQGARVLGRDWPGQTTEASFGAEAAPAGTEVLFCYGEGRPQAQDWPLYTDDWVAVAPRTEPSLKALRRCKLWHPPLGSAQERQIRAYCDRNALPQPWLVVADARARATAAGDVLEVFLRKGDEAALLAPRSLIGPWLARYRLEAYGLPQGPGAPVVARITTDDPGRRAIAQSYLRGVCAAFAGEEAMPDYRPVVTLRQLRYADETLRAGSVNAAAARLGVAQPALSVQIRKLETALGAPLFRRGPRRLESLPEQAARAGLLHRIVARADALLGRPSGMPVPGGGRGQGVTLGLSPLLARTGVARTAIAAAVSAFGVAEEGAAVTLIELPAGELIRRLEAGILQICLCETVAAGPRAEELAPLGRLGVLLPEPANGVPADGTPLGAAELARIPLLAPPRNDAVRQALDRIMRAAGQDLAPRVETDDPDLARTIGAQAGLALLCCEALLADLAPDGAARFRPLRPAIRLRAALFRAEGATPAVDRLARALSLNFRGP